MDNNNKQIKDKTIYIILAIVTIALLCLYFVSTNKNKSNNTSNYNYNSYQNNTTSNEYTKTPKKEVIVEDFSTMTKDDIKNWFTQKNIKGKITEEYSSIVEKGNYIRQSIPANSTIYEGESITVYYSLGKEPTLGEKNALKRANSYLSHSNFSYKSLIEQLEYEGFSNEEAIYAVDNCGADWKKQAVQQAKSYISHSAFSYNSLIEQLEYEGFTDEESVYGVDNCGADWNEQAAQKAKSYMSHSSFSRSGLMDQLEYEGFTDEQIEYGLSAVGY